MAKALTCAAARPDSDHGCAEAVRLCCLLAVERWTGGLPSGGGVELEPGHLAVDGRAVERAWRWTAWTAERWSLGAWIAES
jgi:hypothetical protein